MFDLRRTDGYSHIIIICSGSVASVKVPLIVQELLAHDKVRVQVVATKSSLVFFNLEEVNALGTRVWRDQDEWPDNYKIGDPILHIELRRWADLVLVAPCSANMLSKMAHGLCDNLATSLLRALSPSTPTYIFPAMNTLMYEHPLTNQHLKVVTETIGYKVVGPIGKGLACGDTGIGAMTEWRDIVKLVVDHFGLLPKQ
ncbi:flavoprotein [Flagelloscypha sp. PMI_526]|nr:flavoprotein [Flagelloscypha sp. PMI_526]